MVSYISVLFYKEQQKCAGRYCFFLFFFERQEKKRDKTFTYWQTLVCADIIAVEEKKINPSWLFCINVNEKQRILQEEM